MDSAGARAIAAQALAITSQDWSNLGFSDDAKVAPDSSAPVIVDRIVSLMAIRAVALLSTLDDFDDFSTTCICRTILLDHSRWPSALTREVIIELRAYVERIVQGYQDTPYHNREHAYHVTLSANKLLDLMLISDRYQDNGHQRVVNLSNISDRHNPQSLQLPAKIPKTYGLRRDALLQFVLIFSAMIHDVHHRGISNRQLMLEDDPLTILFNDTSILEQQSLTIAFTEFLQPDFQKVRNLLFPTRDLYNTFRKRVIDLVLATDIANPERMQLTKDKWKTSFGDIEQQDEERRRRESAITEITLQRSNNTNNLNTPTNTNLSVTKESRRRSIGSIFSELTVDFNALGSGDEEFSDSSENIDDPDYNNSGMFSNMSGSFEVMETIDSSQSDIKNDGSTNHHRSRTPESTLSLEKIEELDANDDINSQNLGYSTALQNGDRSLGTRSRSPKRSSAPSSVSQLAKNTRAGRRGSNTSAGMTAFRRRRASMADGSDGQIKRMQRRLSASSAKTTGDILLNPPKFRQRLGIMRSLDLGGETIENFSRKGSINTAASKGSYGGNKRLRSAFPFEEYDEPDDLRAVVVLETIILSCDVAHNLQSYDHMLKWSQKLFWELHIANQEGRGFDPTNGWVGGQTGFLQNYVMPLAQKLGASGVFGNTVGPTFAKAVRDIIDTWEIHGEEATALLLSDREVDLLAHCSMAKLAAAQGR